MARRPLSQGPRHAFQTGARLASVFQLPDQRQALAILGQHHRAPAGGGLLSPAVGELDLAVYVAVAAGFADGTLSPLQDSFFLGAVALAVEVDPVTTSEFTDYIRIIGEVEALHDVTVAGEESGVIKQFFVDKGAPVRKDQPIAKLKDDILAAQVQEAWAVANVAQEQFKRQRELWQNEKIGSELVYLEAKSRADAAAARLNMLETRLANTTVRAPLSGIFDEQYLEVGEMAVAGAPLVGIISTDKVKIIGGVPERFSLSVQPGDSAWITIDILPDRRFAGRISYVGSAVDAGSRTFPIEVILDNPRHQIKPRMLANLQLVEEHLTEVIILPRQVVERTEDGYIVYVAENNQGHYFAASREVTLGSAQGNQVVVQRGLSVGDLLITLGHHQVDNGVAIRIINLGSEELAGKAPLPGTAPQDN